MERHKNTLQSTFKNALKKQYITKKQNDKSIKKKGIKNPICLSNTTGKINSVVNSIQNIE